MIVGVKKDSILEKVNRVFVYEIGELTSENDAMGI